MMLNSTKVLNAFFHDCKEVLLCAIRIIDLHTGYLLIAIINMMQNVVK